MSLSFSLGISLTNQRVRAGTPPVAAPVLMGATISATGSDGLLTATLAEGTTPGTPITFVGYIRETSDAPLTNGAAVAAGDGAAGTFSVTTTVGAVDVAIALIGEFANVFDVDVAARFEDSGWSNVITITSVEFNTLPDLGWGVPIINSTGDGLVNISAGADAPLAPSAPIINGVGDGSVSLSEAA